LNYQSLKQKPGGCLVCGGRPFPAVPLVHSSDGATYVVWRYARPPMKFFPCGVSVLAVHGLIPCASH
jgi:hypothetical protein